MTREIKFRAWNKKGKSMELFNELICGLSENQTETTLEQFFRDRDFIFMQFTGLLDKNGKEIYEGDIVRYGDNGTEQQYPVSYSEISACFIPRRKSKNGNVRKFEIIGNIYQNPELLKS